MVNTRRTTKKMFKRYIASIFLHQASLPHWISQSSPHYLAAPQVLPWCIRGNRPKQHRLQLQSHHGYLRIVSLLDLQLTEAPAWWTPAAKVQQIEDEIVVKRDSCSFKSFYCLSVFEPEAKPNCCIPFIHFWNQNTSNSNPLFLQQSCTYLAILLPHSCSLGWSWDFLLIVPRANIVQQVPQQRCHETQSTDDGSQIHVALRPKGDQWSPVFIRFQCWMGESLKRWAKGEGFVGQR